MIRELLWAEYAIEVLRGAVEFEGYEKSWIDYLHYLDQGWNKIKNQ